MSVTANKVKMKYIHFSVVFALMFLFRFIPPFGTITPYGMTVIGIFIGLIYGWSVDADNLCWSSIMGIVAIGVSDFGNAGTALATAFGNQSVMLMLMAMFFIGMMQESHLTEWLANAILGAKFVEGRPWLLTAFLVIVPAVSSIAINQTMVALIMFIVYKSIFEQAGYQKGDLYPAMVLMGFMLVSCFVFSLLPFFGWPLMTVGIAIQAGIDINMAGWMITTFVTLIVACIGWMIVMFITPGCKVDKLKAIDITQFRKEMAPLNKMQKAVLVITIAQIVGCIALTFMSGTTGWRLVVAKIGVYGWLLLCIAVAMVWHIDGKPVLNKKTAPAYFYWDLILVVAVATVVANQITSETAGITPMIGKVMAPVFSLPSYVFLLALGTITLILTNFANNVAVTITMLTIAMSMATQVQFNLQVALMIITVMGVIGLLTPAGSVNGAMIHAHDYTTTKSAYIAGTIMIIFVIIVMALVTIPLGLKMMV